MKRSLQIVLGAASLLILSACGGANHQGESGKNVTSRFLRTVGNQGYSTESDPSTMMMISSDGEIRTIHLGDCQYYVESTVTGVTAGPNKTFVVHYMNTGAGLLGSSAKNDTCVKFIADFKKAHVPQAGTMTACSYSKKGIDFSCTADEKGTPGNKFKKWN